jgi:hypothetical protein
LLQAFYSIRSERQLVERIEFDLLFRWFVGIGMDDPGWEATTFTKNRDRLLAGEIAGSHQRRRHWPGAKRRGFSWLATPTDPSAQHDAATDV